MSLRKYKKIKYLGKGSYGAAIMVELRSNTSQKFVLKEIIVGHMDSQQQREAKKEARVLHQMSHPNITMYVESFIEDNSRLYIVMEYADGGDLTAAITRRKSPVDGPNHWTEAEAMRIFVQVSVW
jgi:NIMA (never in mitosis gene a)-related kinase